MNRRKIDYDAAWRERRSEHARQLAELTGNVPQENDVVLDAEIVLEDILDAEIIGYEQT